MKTIRSIILILLSLLLLPAFYTNAAEEELRVTPPEGREDAIGYLTDNNPQTRLTVERQKSVLIEWDAADAVSLLLNWYKSASEVLIEVLDENGATVSRFLTKSTPYKQQVNVTGGSKVRITPQKGRACLTEVELYHAGEPLPYDETDTYEADLLIICSGAADECRLFGGLIPLYAAEHNIRTAIVYIRSDYGYVVSECFEALSTLGFSEYPVFMNRNDQNASTEDTIRKNWRTTLTTDLWQVIRKIQPKVIVTMDPGNESEHARTRVAAKIVRELVKSYGARDDVPLLKFYTLSTEGSTVLDWKIPLSTFSGKTAYEVAQEALDQYENLKLYGYSVPDVCRFNLVYSEVGEDTKGNDLFENIDTDRLAGYTAAEHLPVPTPTPVPTVGAVSEPKRPGGGLGVIALAALCALLPLILKKKTALAAGLAACLLLFGGINTAEAEEVPAEQEITAEEETAEPETTAKSETAEVPPPDDDYWYRQSDDPAEVISSDYVTGHWEYRNDYLSILIDRECFTLNGNPQCIYVAYIRSREVDSFRCGLSSESSSGTLIMPWKMARMYKAVLAITGDNLTNAEERAKGILIRNGEFYCDYQAEDSMAVYSSAKIGLIKKGTVSGLQLLDSGVKNCYSFGPVLVENGEVNPDVSKHRVAKGNPRCGLGMIEEGCLVAIVADGRDPSRAYNLTLEEFAEIFKSKGVDFAYNLDGGNSTGMVFMGESISCHSNGTGQRTWVDSLLWGYSEQVPKTSDPVKYQGEGDKGYEQQ